MSQELSALLEGKKMSMPLQSMFNKEQGEPYQWHADCMPDKITPGPTGDADQSLPLRFWEIEYFLKCPVVGSCLDMAEQRHILKKARIASKKMSPFEIHEAMVGRSESENNISRRIDCLLNRKFKKEITSFFKIERDDFIRLWKSRLEEGEFEGLLWVAASRPDLPGDVRRDIFGDIHMHMHLNAGQFKNLKLRLSSEEEKNYKLAYKLRESKIIIRSFKNENEKLEKEKIELQRKASCLENKNMKFKNEWAMAREDSGISRIETENRDLVRKLGELSREIECSRQSLNSLQNQNDRLLLKLDKQDEINSCLRRETEKIITEFSTLNQCDETCPSFDLCKKRILIVGGITKMEDRYRGLVVEKGGIFEYHDGYMNRGTKGLESSVRRADVVLCPVNCNSHTACLTVKKLSKRYNKPVQMLAGSGLSAISQALQEYQDVLTIQ